MSAAPPESIEPTLALPRVSGWNWGNGRRWGAFEEFADSQYAWGFAGRILLLFEAVSIVKWVHFWLTIDRLR